MAAIRLTSKFLERPRIALDPEWSKVLVAYQDDHQDPRNQACHSVGIPMIMASLPIGATVVGLPLAAGLFSVGWAFQFAGHLFEGKKPSFVNDKRSFVVGPLWLAEKLGLAELERSPAG